MQQQQKRILLLEDDTTIREVTYEYLKENHYAVTTATNGREALAYLQEATEQATPFNLAILDIMTPFVTGLKVLETIQAKKLNIATIMLTALNDEKTQLKAFDLYADDYVTKPFSPKLLLRRVEAVLRRYQGGHHTAGGGASYEIGGADGTRGEANTTGLVIDNYNAYWNGASLKLTLTEFLLLEVLCRNQGRVFTREELLDAVFHDDFNVNDRIIDAHVKNLRKKLPLPWVETVRGVGYRFDRLAVASKQAGVSARTAASDPTSITPSDAQEGAP